MEYTVKKSQDVLFSETSFVHSRSGTYYALLLGYFGMKFLPDVRHCVYWVLAETWAPDSSQEIGNKFFIHHCKGWRNVCLCVKLFDFFRGWILLCLTRNLSRFVSNSMEILTWNFRKKLFRENFSEILCKPKTILYQNLWNFTQLCAILLWVRIAL